MDRRPHVRLDRRALLAVAAAVGVTIVSVGTLNPGPAGAAGPAAPHGAAPPVARIVDYPTPANTFPAALTSGPQGKLWFTEDISKAQIGSFDPSHATFANHALNMGIFAFKAQGIAVDRSGHLWMSANGSYAYQFDPANSTSENYQKAVSGSEQSVTLGSDGDMWFTGSSLAPGSFIYRVDPKTATFTPYPVAGGSGYLFGIAVGPGGNLWFVDPGNNAIGQLDPSNGHTAEYTIPTPNSSPGTITAGPDHALWFTERATDKIGRIDPHTHVITEFDIPTADTSPRGITAGPDGRIWFTEQAHAAIGSVDPATGAVREYSVAGVDPNGGHTFLDGIVTGPDGSLWVTDEGDQLLKFSLTPQIVVEPSSHSVPTGSTATFSSTARGIPVPSVRWQMSGDGGKTWSAMAGATSTTLSLTASERTAADEYRAEFTNSAGTAFSTPVSLHLSNSSAGYWLAGRDGGVFAFGSAPFFGSLPSVGREPASPIVAMVATPSGDGYWLVGSDGGVFAFGDAGFFGSLPARGVTPNQPVVGAAASPDGRGYWLVGSDGGVYAFGDASYAGGAPAADGSSVAIAAAGTRAGAGYWVANQLGGVVAAGAARSHGSLTMPVPTPLLAAPIVALTASVDGGGYWLVGADGGVFAFGDAGFSGSLPGSTPPIGARAPVTGIASVPDGGGYWLAGTDGGVFAFGDAGFFGSLPALGISLPASRAIESIAARP